MELENVYDRALSDQADNYNKYLICSECKLYFHE